MCCLINRLFEGPTLFTKTNIFFSTTFQLELAQGSEPGLYTVRAGFGLGLARSKIEVRINSRGRSFRVRVRGKKMTLSASRNSLFTVVITSYFTYVG